MMYHSGIFYPEDKEELSKLVGNAEKKEAHRFFILPHMRLDAIAGLYRTAFSMIPDGRRIIAILPLHREPLEKDRGRIVFTSPDKIVETPLGSVRLQSLGASDASSYEEEEYSLELLYPFVAAATPNATLCPVFVRLEGAEDCRRLAGFLKPYDDGRSIFIVSSNMTARMDGAEAERDRMIGLIEGGEHLIDLWRKGRISACGAPAIECLSRIGGGRWRLIGVGEDERLAGHAAFNMEC